METNWWLVIGNLSVLGVWGLGAFLIPRARPWPRGLRPTRASLDPADIAMRRFALGELSRAELEDTLGPLGRQHTVNK